MKNLLYYLSIVFMLIACNVKEHRDGINNHGESSSTADSSTAKSQIKILQPTQKTIFFPVSVEKLMSMVNLSR